MSRAATRDPIYRRRRYTPELKSGRAVFNIKANDYRLIALVEYKNGVVMIRFFGSHEEYDKITAETV